MKFIFYRSAFPELSDSVIVIKVSNPDGTPTFRIEGTEEVLSFQSDGTWQTRHMSAIGPWEKADISGNIATFNSFGTIGHFALFQIPN